MDNKDRTHLTLINPPAIELDDDLPFEDQLNNLTLREKLQWRGIQNKTIFLAMAAMSIMCSVIILLTLAATLAIIS